MKRPPWKTCCTKLIANLWTIMTIKLLGQWHWQETRGIEQIGLTSAC